MKKITVVSLASFAFLLVCSSVAVLLEGIIREDAVMPIIIGVLLLALSAVLAFFAKERIWLNVVCFLISAVSMGFLIRAWYINRGFENDLGVMCAVSFATVLYLWIFFALSRIPFFKASKTASGFLLAGYAILSIIIYIIAVFKTETTYVSTLGYYMIIEFAFMFAMSLEVNSRKELVRNLTLSTYSLVGVALIISVFVLIAALGGDADCDCDCMADGCCDGADCCDFSSGGKKRKTKKSK